MLFSNITYQTDLTKDKKDIRDVFNSGCSKKFGKSTKILGLSSNFAGIWLLVIRTRFYMYYFVYIWLLFTLNINKPLYLALYIDWIIHYMFIETFIHKNNNNRWNLWLKSIIIYVFDFIEETSKPELGIPNWFRVHPQSKTTTCVLEGKEGLTLMTSKWWYE